MTDGEGEKRKERRKKTNTEGINVQETPLHIQIPLGFHSDVVQERVTRKDLFIDFLKWKSFKGRGNAEPRRREIKFT
ncbi:hypothetical protein MUG91_G167n6 [Manis pentadactyla]|nr:hypothetical protein MUG91_G167n6 [Manis pentadactyla]